MTPEWTPGRAVSGTDRTRTAAPYAPMPVDPGAMLDQIPGIFALIGDDGLIWWVSDAVEPASGFRPEELVGTNFVDHVDIEGSPLVLESLAYALTNPGLRLPTVMRMLVKDGSPMVVEATANNQFDNPDLGCMVVHLRPCAEQQMLDNVMEAIATGAETEATLRMLHPIGWGETLRADTAIVLGATYGGGPTVLGSSPTVEQFTASAHHHSAWLRSADSGTPQFWRVDELPAPLGESARQAGYEACWAYPIPNVAAGANDAVLLFWRRATGSPEPTAAMLCQRLAQLTGLVLERAEHARVLQHAATHDQLTGLVNRAEFFRHVDEHLSAQRSGLGVLYLDLDGFKPVNDQFGHGTGDQVLKHVAERLAALLRPGDVVARLGGDEFAMCCPDAGSRELATIAERLIDAMAAPVLIEGRDHTIGVTVGLVAAAAGACSSDVLVAAADAALLRAKASSKGTWQASAYISAT
ncbi:MAG: GGDEF domain-containing protein [Aquihabitans sp.]